MKACQVCGLSNDPDSIFCEHCGAKLSDDAPDGAPCPNPACRFAANDPSSAFCPACGAKLDVALPMDESRVFIIRRKSQLMAGVVSYQLRVDDETVGRLRSGQSYQLETHRSEVYIDLSSNMLDAKTRAVFRVGLEMNTIITVSVDAGMALHVNVENGALLGQYR